MLLTRAGLSAIGALVFSFIIIISPTIVLAQVADSTGSTTLITGSSPQATTDSTSSPQATPALDPYNQADVETAVREYFADVPVMANIAKCESNFRQYDASGTLLNGGSGGMVGVFQINKSVHAKFALTLGDDITTLAGNMAYARYLYANEGTTPWDSSKGCWGVTAKATTFALSTTVNTNLQLGSVDPQVTTLQQLLNAAGYVVAKSGAGSPGQETTKFGAATKAALQRFQCAQHIVCKGSESTTGYGFAGVKTRAALMVNS